MEQTHFSISIDKEIHHFRVEEHPHIHSGTCKYLVYENNQKVASFEPDAQGFLHICQNPANLSEDLLHLLADQIEARHPQERNFTELEQIEFDSDDEMEAPPQTQPGR